MKRERRARSEDGRDDIDHDDTSTSDSRDTHREGQVSNGYTTHPNPTRKSRDPHREGQTSNGYTNATGPTSPSKSERVRYKPGHVNHSPRGRAGATDQRRTQSERRASSRERRPAWGRQINAHVRSTWETVLEVRRRVKAFQREHLGQHSKYDFVACTKCLEEDILPQWGMAGEKDQLSSPPNSRRTNRVKSVKDYDDFLNLSLRKEADEDTMRSYEYMDLMDIANRARYFQILVPDCRRKLENCFESHAKPHLVSLKHVSSSSPDSSSKVPSSSQTSEENGHDNAEELHSVETYDKASKQHSHLCEQKIKSVKDTYKSYKQKLRPFLEFVRNGDTQTALMTRCCEELLDICKMFDEWASEDDAYPDKLLEEMDEKKKRREEHREEIKKIKLTKEEKMEQIARLKRKEGKAAQRYHEYRNSKEKLIERLTELTEREAMLEDRINSKREEKQRLRESRNNEENQSPRRSIENSERLEILGDQITKLEREKNTARKQIKRVEQDMKPTSDKTYENKVEMVTFRHQREEIVKSFVQMDAEVATLKTKMVHLDEQRDKLNYIRELKISPEAYRKCLRQIRKEEVSKADGTQALASACQQAAPSVGKQWQKLYFLLPFDPPRDLDKRHRDVVVLDTISSRKDLTDKQAALRSLEKWRTFHRRGVVTDLTKALRDMKKSGLASKIEKAFNIK